jgi:hypothetical protein
MKKTINRRNRGSRDHQREKAIRKILYRFIEWFKDPDSKPPGSYYHFTESLIPSLLALYIKHGFITQQERDTLMSQFESPDSENAYIAMMSIKHKIQRRIP